jgi:hypothetical protein
MIDFSGDESLRVRFPPARFQFPCRQGNTRLNVSHSAFLEPTTSPVGKPHPDQTPALRDLVNFLSVPKIGPCPGNTKSAISRQLEIKKVNFNLSTHFFGEGYRIEDSQPHPHQNFGPIFRTATQRSSRLPGSPSDLQTGAPTHLTVWPHLFDHNPKLWYDHVSSCLVLCRLPIRYPSLTAHRRHCGASIFNPAPSSNCRE